MFEKENIIILIAFVLAFTVMWQSNISPRNKAKKEDDDAASSEDPQ